jgi:hypothetical protein
MKNKISMTCEQFNKFGGLLRETHESVRNAAMAADPVYKMMLKNSKARALTCKIASDLDKAWDTFFEINELLQNVKDTYMNEISNKIINKEGNDDE